MSFYGQGDYYGGQGDPGLFDFIKRIGGIATHFLPLPLKAVAAAGSVAVPAVIRKRQEQIASGALQPNVLGRALMHTGASRPGIGIMAPGGGRGLRPARISKGGRILGAGRRRRMNPANVKALHRSVRRLLGFKHLVASVQMSLGGIAGPKGRGKKKRCAGCGRARCVCHRTPLLLRGDGDL